MFYPIPSFLKTHSQGVCAMNRNVIEDDQYSLFCKANVTLVVQLPYYMVFQNIAKFTVSVKKYIC